MASRFLQKYYLPEGFKDILSELVRETLRAQPDDILEFLANYCEARANGQVYEYDSIYNFKQREIPQEPPKEYYQSLEDRARQLVASSNQQPIKMVPEKEKKKRTLLDDIPEPMTLNNGTLQQDDENKQYMQQTTQEQNENEDDQQQNQDDQDDENDNNYDDNDQNQQKQTNSQQSRQQSAVSDGRVSNTTSHPDEKGVGRQYMGDLYSSALQNLQKSGNQEDANFAQEVKDNKEQFDQAARFIQGKYKEQKQKQLQQQQE